MNQALNGIPILLAPFEQMSWEVAAKIIGMYSQTDIYSMKPDDIRHAVESLEKYPIYFLDHHGKMPISDLKDAVYNAVHKHGVKRLLIDHLHFFLDMGKDERRVIEDACNEIHIFTKELDIHSMVVVHPTKLEKYKGQIFKPTLNDLRGAAAITQIADNGIRVHREREENVGSRSDPTEISVMKCRSPAGQEGVTWLTFDPNGEVYSDNGMRPEENVRRNTRQRTKGKDDEECNEQKNWQDVF